MQELAAVHAKTCTTLESGSRMGSSVPETNRAAVMLSSGMLLVQERAGAWTFDAGCGLDPMYFEMTMLETLVLAQLQIGVVLHLEMVLPPCPTGCQQLVGKGRPANSHSNGFCTVRHSRNGPKCTNPLLGAEFLVVAQRCLINGKLVESLISCRVLSKSS